MKTILFIALQIIAASGILYGYYHLALRNKKFHQYNRFYLLCSVVISILIPFLNIPLYFEEGEIHSSVVLQTLQTISAPVADRENVTPQIISAGTTPTPFNWNSVLYGLYLLAIAVLLLRTLISLRKIRLIIKNNPVEDLDGIHFVNTTEPGTPFSFFRWLFWNKRIEIRSDKGEQILRHEVFHIQQKHSLDILFMEAVTAIFWINPFFHLIKKEQKAIHEFLADQFALHKTDQWAYAELLLMQALNTQQRLVNPFFHNQIKRRIAMITNPKKTSHRYLRKLLVLPVTAAVVTLFAFKYKNKNHEPVIRANETITIVVDPGHGGIDPGVKSADNKITEAQLNLELAEKIRSLANEYNVNVVMTRENDQLPGGASTAKDGLLNRLNIVNKINPTALVSVHINASQSKANYQGFEVYITDKRANKGDERLASLILTEMTNVYWTSKDIKQREDHGIFVLDKAPCPAVLLECGYINNPADLAFISQSKNQEKVARAILNSIVKYSDSVVNFGNTMPKDSVPAVKVLHTTSAPTKRSPSANDLKKWMDEKMYGVWLDEKRINNSELANFKPGDFSYYFVSKLEKNAINYGKHYYQVDLMTHDYYKKAYSRPNYLMWERAPGDTSNPLIVIDGKLRPGLTLRNIDKGISVSDIVSMNVLKGPAAIKKYGDAAKNGVIEIYTGKSKEVTQWDPNNIDNDKVFEKVEIEPAFPGGDEAWRKFLERNVNPTIPVQNGLKAGKYTVYIQFIVGKDGTISNVRALTNYGFGMEQEAIRVIKTGPSWAPALQNGQKVNAYRKQPITFEVIDDKNYGMTVMGHKTDEKKDVLVDKNPGKDLNEVVVVGFLKSDSKTKTDEAGKAATTQFKEVTIGGQDCQVLDKVEIEAAFPGGESAWKKYLDRNLNTLVAVQNNAPKGDYTIYVQFTVYCDGYVGNVAPLTNHGFGMEKEAMRMIKNGPKWVPAMLNGQKVGSVKKVSFVFVSANKVSTNNPKNSSSNAVYPVTPITEKDNNISITELKKTNPVKLLGLREDATLSSFLFTIDQDKDVASISNTGKEFSEAIVKLINSAGPGHMITLENIMIVWNGKSQKIPARFFYVTN